MGLVSRWDIRDEAYADGVSVSSLADRAGTTTLNNNATATFPTRRAASNSMEFSADACAIASAALAAGLAAVPQGSAWSMFCLVNQSAFGAGMFCGFGAGTNDQQGVLMRDDASGAVTCLVRDSSSVNNVAVSSGTRTLNTWHVVHMIYTGANIVVGFDGGNTGSVARTANLAGDTWTQFCIGAFFRNSIGIHANGLYREIRVYDSNETANLAAIVASMQAGGGPSPGSASLVALRRLRRLFNQLLSFRR